MAGIKGLNQSQQTQFQPLQQVSTQTNTQVKPQTNDVSSFSVNQQANNAVLGQPSFQNTHQVNSNALSSNSVFNTMLGLMTEQTAEVNNNAQLQSTPEGTERAISLAKLSGLGEGADGYSFGEHQNGIKDGFISESEVKALIAGWQNTDADATVIEAEVNKLNGVLQQIQSEGQLIEVPMDTGSEPLDLEELGTLLDKEISSYQRTKADKLIQTANTSSEIHNNIPDQLELAVFGYTTSDYREINKALRSGDESKIAAKSTYIQGIEEGLSQMPSYQGTVYRGSRLSDDILSKYEPGVVVREAAFTSTSHDSKKKFSGNVTFVIQTRKEGSRGKLVEKLSNFPSEKEVLFNRDAEFFVLKKEQDPNNSSKTIVYMQEL